MKKATKYDLGLFLFKIHHHKVMLVCNRLLHNQHYTIYLIHKPHIKYNINEFQLSEQCEKFFFIEKPNKYDFSLFIIISIQYNIMMLVVENFWYNQEGSIYTIPTQLLK